LAILAGAGALHATEELINAELLGAGIAKRCSARPPCPMTCPSSPAIGCSEPSRAGK